MQVQWMEKPTPAYSYTYGLAATSGQSKRVLPQLCTCSGYYTSPYISHTIKSTLCCCWIQCSVMTIAQFGVAALPLHGFKGKVERDLGLTLGKWSTLLISCSTSSYVADHVSHLENVSEEEINRLLGMVVDVENLFMSVHKEEDTDTKQVYFYLFKVCDQFLLPNQRMNTQTHPCTHWQVTSISIADTAHLDPPYPCSVPPAAEKMHLADEPAHSGGIIGEPPLWETQHWTGDYGLIPVYQSVIYFLLSAP